MKKRLYDSFELLKNEIMLFLKCRIRGILKKTKNLILLFAIESLIICILCGINELSAKVGNKAPVNFIIPDLGKKEHILFREHIKGKKVILNFFASYCVPCKEEIPEIQNLVSNYPDVKLLFINIDDKAEIAKVESLVHEWNIQYPVLLDSYQVAINQYAKEQLAVPATFVIDPKGIIRFESFGYKKDTLEKLETVLKKL